MDAFNEVTNKAYKEQATFYMNAYWPDEFEKNEQNREDIFRGWQLFIEVDKLQWEEVHKKIWKQGWTEGNSLDELFSHKYLEKIGRTLTVVAFRNEFRKIDVNFDKRMAMIEYLLFVHNHAVGDLMSKPQGENSKELQEAQAQVEAVQKALSELQAKFEEQKELVAAQKKAEEAAQAALESQKAAETAAHQKLESQKAAQAAATAALESQQLAEAQVRKAESELAAAVADLKRQEDEHKALIDGLEAKAHDLHLGVVAKNKAANEAAQLKGKDPLPLRKAKITQEAALHAVEKERKAAELATVKAVDQQTKATKARADAEEATQKAAEARQEAERQAADAETARLEAEEQARQVEAAVSDAFAKFEAAKVYLEEQKKKAGSRQGYLWWISRELTEAGKYLPPKGSKV